MPRLVPAAALERLRDENRAIWNELWKGRITVDGADARWQSITDASTYYLLSSVHASSLASTSLFGLAYWPNYHYYHGHVMWDIETFTVPPLLLLAPDAARALLDYRHRHLEAARQNAALHGWRGAMYPWESCPIHGDEVTPGARPYTEDHVSLDIALAFASYVHATGDMDYARRYRLARAPRRCRVRGVPRRADARGFEIATRSGLERTYEPVDNNAYTNMAAAASRCARPRDRAGRSARTPPPAWTEIADGLVLPRDTRRGRDHQPRWCAARRATGRSPGGRRRAVPGRLPASPRPSSAPRIDTRSRSRRRAMSVRPMLSALLPVYAARGGDPALGRANCSSAATASSSTSRSSSRTSTLAREPIGRGRRRCSRT